MALELVFAAYGDLAYTGNVLAQAGDDAAATTLTDGCFDLSDNFITVNREEVNGGMVSTEDGETEVYTCPGDGIADIIMFDSTNVVGPNFTYVITDENTVILGVPGMDMADLEGAGVGTCLVWGLAYTGNLMATLGDTAATTILTDGCFDLSDNFITIYRETPNGGTVSTEDGDTEVTVTVGDGMDDLVAFDSAGVSNSLFTYVVTDESNVILAVPGGDVVNFEEAGTGICRVWGLAYTGNIIAAPGDTASVVDITDECFDLSDNFVNVIRLDSLVGPGDEEVFRFNSSMIELASWPNPASDILNLTIDRHESMEASQAIVRIIDANGKHSKKNAN